MISKVLLLVLGTTRTYSFALEVHLHHVLHGVGSTGYLVSRIQST